MQKQTYNPQKVRSLLVEVELTNLPVGVGQSEYPFSQNSSLRDAVGILSVEAFNTTLMTKGPSGKTNMPDAAYRCTYLSLFNSNDVEIRSKLPVAGLIRSNGNSRIEPLNIFGDQVHPKPIDPQKSKIIIGDNTAALAGQVAIFLVTYVAP